MKTILLLAWRNLWRNKRRTLITAASVFFGVIFSALMSSMQEGTYSSNIDNIVRFYSGYLQLQHPEYQDEETLDHHITVSEKLLEQINGDPRIEGATSRLESFALASNKNITKVGQVVGIDPDAEKKVTRIKSNIMAGRYLKDDEKGILIGKTLAENLKIDVGDTLILTGQGYRYATAADLFPVVGLLDFPIKELNKTMIYMPLKICQEFYNAQNLLTSLVVILHHHKDLEPVKKHLKQIAGHNRRVITWKEMQPAMVQQIESDRASGVIFKTILYMVIFFGILGTIMMMMSERRRELGVMMAVGMKRFRLSAMMTLETFFIALLGTGAGLAGSLPVVGFFFHHPISLKGQSAEVMADYGWEPFMKFSLAPEVFWHQALIVFTITLMLSVYPLLTIKNMKAINALRA
jgi:ABC-type lipoprotein release transport system permease subunit